MRNLFGIRVEGFKSTETYITTCTQLVVDIGAPVEEDFIRDLMLSGLSPEYNPMIMVLENSRVKITSDFIKSKLIQEDLRQTTEQDASESALLSNCIRRVKSSGAKRQWFYNCSKSGCFKHYSNNPMRTKSSVFKTGDYQYYFQLHELT